MLNILLFIAFHRNFLLKLSILFIYFGLTKSFSQDAMVTVYPKVYDKALNNPYKGFRLDLEHSANAPHPYTAIVRHYIKWSDIESNEFDDYTKIKAFTDQKWKGLSEKNIRVIPRIYVDWNKKSGNEYWPQDILDKTGLQSDDPNLWKTQIVKDRLVNLVYKMGKAWDNDARVAWIQTGLVGYWGEQENPIGIDEENYAKILGDAFKKGFINKKMVVRNQNDWDEQDYKWGVYWDSFGHPEQEKGAWNTIRNTNKANRYLTEIVEGEVAYNWGKNTFDPIYGGEPSITLGNKAFTNNMIDVIKELHATGLGWIASYDLNGNFNTDPSTVKLNADRMQRAFGYRFLITKFSSSKQTDFDGNLYINFKIKNVGSAPFYQKWPLALVLIDVDTEKVIYSKLLENVDITQWHPGNNYSYELKEYSEPAIEYAHKATFNIPKEISKGQYYVGLSILEPNSKSPGIFFAVENFLRESQTQPLLKVGIHQSLKGNPAINIPFNDILQNDKRYYSLKANNTEK